MSTVLFLALTLASAGDRYVEVGGDNTANTCENAGTPCATIESATTQAQTGETIFVGAGTFSSTAALYPLQLPDGVSLQGMGPTATVMRGNGPLLEVGGPTGQTLSSLALDVLSGNESAVYGYGALQLTVDNLMVSGGYAGLDLSESYSSAHVDIRDTVFDGMSFPVNIGGFSGTFHTTLDNVTISNAETGIQADLQSSSGSYSVIVDELTVNNTTEAVTIDLQGFFSTLDIRLADSTFTDVNSGLNASYTEFCSGSAHLLRTNGTALGSPMNITLSSMANVEVVVADLTAGGVENGWGTEAVGGSTLRTSVVDVDISQDAGADGLYLIADNFGDHLAALRNVSISGGTSGVLLEARDGAHMGPTIDGLTIQGTQFPVLVSASSSAFVEANIRSLDISEHTGTGLLLTGSGSGGFGVDVHGAHISSTQAGSRGVDMYASSRGSLLLDNTTISGGYHGVTVSGSTLSSAGQVDLEIRRSEITGTEESAVLFTNCFAGTCNLDVNRSRVADNGNAGIHIGFAPPSNANLSITNTMLMNNATLYGYGSAYNGFDVAAVSSSSATVDASSNWWGTTNQGQISSRVQSYGPPIDTTPAWDNAHSFQVAPPRGTPRGGELLLIREPGAPSLVDRMGDRVAQVLVGTTPAEVIWSSIDGDRLRAKVPPMVPGLYDVHYTGPEGYSGSVPAAYEVANAPDVLTMRHQDFVERTGTFVRVSNASPGANIRMYFSPAIDGPPACPPELGGGCLQIPGPLAVARPSTANLLGIAWERIGPPGLANHPVYVTGQAVELFPGGGFSVSPVVVQAWVDDKGDEDQDGVDNREEHRMATSIFRPDSEGDGCWDREDRDPLRSSTDSDQTGRPDDCERW